MISAMKLLVPLLATLSLSPAVADWPRYLGETMNTKPEKWRSVIRG